MIYSIVNSNLFCFMKRNFFIFPLLITSWFLNSGFLFKPNITEAKFYPKFFQFFYAKIN